MDDYGKLKNWAKLMRSGDVAIGVIRSRMADEVLKLIDRGFERQKDPYENPWAPKKRPNGYAILHGPTHRLRPGWHKLFLGARRFLVQPNVPYAAAHQAPRHNRRPRRAMVPYGNRKLPLRWRARLMRAAIEGFIAHIRGRL
jgi:phage gpG-like protein